MGTQAGTPAPPTGAPQSNLTPQQIFNAAYWAHQPPAVQALRGMDEAAREAAAMKLATQGYQIDVPIMVWGWDPYQTMLMRQQFGYTWVPSALMPPVEMAPGLQQAGRVPYDPTNPPFGAIIVSINPADYPPHDPPPPPPVPPTAPTSLVGMSEGAGYYSAYPAALAQLKDGDAYTSDPRGAFTFHVSALPMGVVFYFTLNPPAAA
jgi:hypothetical protein